MSAKDRAYETLSRLNYQQKRQLRDIHRTGKSRKFMLRYLKKQDIHMAWLDFLPLYGYIARQRSTYVRMTAMFDLVFPNAPMSRYGSFGGIANPMPGAPIGQE